MDWQDALSLDLSDPGFNVTVWHDFRDRFVSHAGSHQLLDTLLEVCKARGWITGRGPQRTDSTPVLAAIRPLHRLDRALETLRAALNQLSEADPPWVHGRAPREGYERYGPRAEAFRPPNERSTRESLAVLMGVDGYALMDAVDGADKARHVRHLPDFEALRRMWMQPYDRGRAPGLEEVRWRQHDEEPPSALRIQSPDALEAGDGTTRDTAWVG
jgi:transposase